MSSGRVINPKASGVCKSIDAQTKSPAFSKSPPRQTVVRAGSTAALSFLPRAGK